jgi:hypothetical protein
MHEWIPVLCGVLLARASDARASVPQLLLRVAALAILVVMATREWAQMPTAIALDMLLIGVGLLLARGAPRVWSRVHIRRAAVSPSD